MATGGSVKMQHIIFGTGPLGMAVMHDLYQRGERSIRMVNRKGIANVPEKIEIVKGDATDAFQTKAICKDAAVVYNCVNAPYHQWVTHFPPLQAGILEGVAAAGAILISAENVYMYGRTGGKPL